MDGAGTDSCCTETENVFEESSLQDLEECGETREEQLVCLLLGVVVRHPQPMFSAIESPRKLISDRAIVSNLSA